MRRDEENVPVHCWYSDSAQDVLGGMWRLSWNRTGSGRVQGGVSRADRWSGMEMLGSGGIICITPYRPASTGNTICNCEKHDIPVESTCKYLFIQ